MFLDSRSSACRTPDIDKVTAKKYNSLLYLYLTTMIVLKKSYFFAYCMMNCYPLAAGVSYAIESRN